jgi:hypothetical protein
MARSALNQYVRMTLPMALRLEAEIDGRVVALSPREHRLLEILLLRGPQWSFLDDLIEMLWPNPDLQPETAVTVIKVAVHRLREKSVRITTKLGGLKAYRIAQPGDVARHKRQPKPYVGRRYAVNPPGFVLGEPLRPSYRRGRHIPLQGDAPGVARSGAGGRKGSDSAA